MLKIKTKGFTIIELVLVIGIIAVFLSFSLINASGYRQLKNKIDVDFFSNSLLNYITNSKEYCRDTAKSGHIFFDSERGLITFNCGIRQINTLPLPDGFSLNDVRADNKIEITNIGTTGSSCTIQFRDSVGKLHDITMRVGTEDVNIK